MAIAVVDRAASCREAVLVAGERWSSGQYELVRAVVALDDSGEWAADGSATCAHWVASALDVEVCTAREWLRVGRCLRELPVVSEAFAAKRLSYSKVRTLTRVAAPASEAELCELAVRVPAGRLGQALAAWSARNEPEDVIKARQHRDRSLSWRTEPDGMIVGGFRLEPAAAAPLLAAIDAWVRANRRHASADASVGPPSGRERESWPSIAQQRADALVALVGGGGAVVSTEVVVHVRGDGCTLDDGTPLGDQAVAHMLDGAFVRALVCDADRRPVNASGRQRYATTRQRRVVNARDGGCVDCGSTILLECDHDPPYELTGRTVVEELVARCAVCHHARHAREGGADE